MLENYRNFIIHYTDNFSDNVDLKTNEEEKLISKTINDFMPMYSQIDSAGCKLIFLLKFVSLIHHRGGSFKAYKPGKLIELKHFIDNAMNEDVSIKQYAKILT